MSTEMVAQKMGAGAHSLALEQACVQFGIQSVVAKCHFLANCAIESAYFRKTVESLDYSVAGLLKTFRRSRISKADAERYGRASGRSADQQVIANIVYGGEFGRRELGNIMDGDGWRFIGRGLIQLTGRANYRAYSRAVYNDDRCVDDPGRLSMPPDAAMSAAWFFTARVPAIKANANDVAAVRAHINPALYHVTEVRREFERALHLFGEMVS